MNDRLDIEAIGDDELVARLAEALPKADPVPAAVTEFAKAAFGWRTIDAELAELVFDSAVDELVGVRSEDDTRQVTFRAPGVEIEVAVMADGVRRIVGQLVPAARGGHRAALSREGEAHHQRHARPFHLPRRTQRADQPALQACRRPNRADRLDDRLTPAISGRRRLQSPRGAAPSGAAPPRGA